MVPRPAAEATRGHRAVCSGFALVLLFFSFQMRLSPSTRRVGRPPCRPHKCRPPPLFLFFAEPTSAVSCQLGGGRRAGAWWSRLVILLPTPALVSIPVHSQTGWEFGSCNAVHGGDRAASFCSPVVTTHDFSLGVSLEGDAGFSPLAFLFAAVARRVAFCCAPRQHAPRLGVSSAAPRGERARSDEIPISRRHLAISRTRV